MNDLQAIEQEIKVFKAQVVTGEALTRLKKNKDFKNIIMGFFLADKVDELIKAKCDPDRQDPKEQAYIEKGLIAAGYLAQLFEELEGMAIRAKNSLDFHEAEREKIAEEGAY